MVFRRARIAADILLSLNLAGLIRAIRHGPVDAGRRLSRSLYYIDPFSRRFHNRPIKASWTN